MANIKLSVPNYKGISINGAVIKDHSKLQNLDFENSGHTGFQKELTFDNAPVNDSDNPVTSGGIYSALSEKQDELTFDDSPTIGSDNPVTSKGILAALNKKVDREEGKSLSSNDYINEDKQKVSHLPDDASAELEKKVDKATGKDLSTNDYTDSDKAKVDNLPDNTTDELSKKADKSALEELKYKSIPHTSVQGYPLSITDSLANENFTGCKVWGNCGKNLIPYPYQTTTQVKNGITFTDNGDGTITVNGTATSYVEFTLCTFTSRKSKKYFLSGCPAGGSESTYYLHMRGYNKDLGNGVIFVPGYDFTNRIDIVINKGTAVDNLIFKPQLEYGSTATEYEKYKAVGNLSSTDGKYHVPVKVCGKNLIPYPYVNIATKANGITYTNNGDGTITANGTATADSEYKFLGEYKVDYPAGDYIFSGCPNGGGYSTYRIEYAATYSGNGWDIIDSRDFGTGLKMTAPKGITKLYGKITIQKGVTVNNLVFKPQLEAGSVITEFEPYTAPSSAEAVLDTQLNEGEYIDLIRKKRVNGSTETDITVTGELKPTESVQNRIICNTSVSPSKIEAEYYQDINKVIAEIKSAILAQGANT